MRFCHGKQVASRFEQVSGDGDSRRDSSYYTAIFSCGSLNIWLWDSRVRHWVDPRGFHLRSYRLRHFVERQTHQETFSKGARSPPEEFGQVFVASFSHRHSYFSILGLIALYCWLTYP